MKNIFKYHFYIFMVLIYYATCAQNKEIDSLKLVVKVAKEDTNKVDLLNSIAWRLKSVGEFEAAWDYTVKAETLSKAMQYKAGLVGVYCNQGLIHLYRGNLPKSLDCQFKSLKFSEDIKSKKAAANALSNIGNIYWHQKNQTKALEYQFKALKLREEYLPDGSQVGDKKAIANSLGNIGIVYDNIGNRKLALEYHLRSLDLMKASGNREGEANTLNNIGNAYAYGEGNNDVNALLYYNKALAIYELLDNKSGIATSYFNIADVYLIRKSYKKAEEFHLKSLKIVEEIGDLEGIRDANLGLYEVYERLNLDEKALFCFKNYISARDSLLNEENTKQTVRLEMNFEFEKKEAVVKLEQEKKDAIANAGRKKQQIIIWSICGILMLVIAFAVYVYRSYLQKQKINIEITNQKHIIEEKQKEILDSIHYAKRIQNVLITSEKYIERSLNKLTNKQ